MSTTTDRAVALHYGQVLHAETDHAKSSDCRQKRAFLKIFKCLDFGSGRKIPAILLGTGTYHGVCIPET